METVFSLNEQMISQGYVFRAEYSTTGLAAAGTFHVGLLAGNDEVVIGTRSYSSSEAILTIELFEATYSAGTDPRIFNRRLNSQHIVPATVKVGVTPGTLGTPITAITLRAPGTTGSSSLQLTADDNLLYLKPNTSYVVRLTNGGAAAANIGSAFDFRRAVGIPGLKS